MNNAPYIALGDPQSTPKDNKLGTPPTKVTPCTIKGVQQAREAAYEHKRILLERIQHNWVLRSGGREGSEVSL